MLNRIAEIRSCIRNKEYEAALALALTLPDICGQVEYPDQKVGARYRAWINNYVDKNILFFSHIFEVVIPTVEEVNTTRTFETITAEDIYQLRCSFLHSGDDDIASDRIDEFHLVKPESLRPEADNEYGYRLISRTREGKEFHIAELNIRLICELLCESAEKYYNSKSPKDFEDHTRTLG